MSPLQESAVGWELRDGPFHHWNLPWHEPILHLFVFVYLVFFLVVIIRVFWKLGPNSGSMRKSLEKALILLKENDKKYYSELKKISNRSPERSLRLLTPEVFEQNGSPEFQNALSSACAEFEYSLRKLSEKIRSFGTFTFVLALLAF